MCVRARGCVAQVSGFMRANHNTVVCCYHNGITTKNGSKLGLRVVCEIDKEPWQVETQEKRKRGPINKTTADI